MILNVTVEQIGDRGNGSMMNLPAGTYSSRVWLEQQMGIVPTGLDYISVTDSEVNLEFARRVGDEKISTSGCVAQYGKPDKRILSIVGGEGCVSVVSQGLRFSFLAE